MSEDASQTDGGIEPVDDQPPFAATRYESGAITYPGHPIGPNGTEPAGIVDLSEYTGTVITWTTSTATPPGVRQPNTLAIVEFEVPNSSGDDSQSVRALGQLTSDEVETGDDVRPVYVEELREPGIGIKDAESAQDWDGYRFEPV